MSFGLTVLLLVIIGLLVAIYRKIPAARSWQEQLEAMRAAHNEAVAESDAVWEEFHRLRQQPEWRDVDAEKVTEEAERRLRKEGVLS